MQQTLLALCAILVFSIYALGRHQADTHVERSATAGEVGPAARYEELTALEDTFLREASALGFSLDEVIIHLDSRRKA